MKIGLVENGNQQREQGTHSLQDLALETGDSPGVAQGFTENGYEIGIRNKFIFSSEILEHNEITNSYFKSERTMHQERKLPPI